MGLYKLCDHKGRNRDRCELKWWGGFRGGRASLSKWASREIRSKADAVLEEMQMTTPTDTFDARRSAPRASL
jgi:hypothetical protein